MNKQTVRATIDALRKEDAPRFDISRWEKQTATCGMAACIGGTAMRDKRCNALGLVYTLDGDPIPKFGNDVGVTAMAQFWQIDRVIAVNICVPEWYGCNIYNMIGNSITRQHAIDMLQLLHDEGVPAILELMQR